MPFTNGNTTSDPTWDGWSVESHGAHPETGLAGLYRVIPADPTDTREVQLRAGDPRLIVTDFPANQPNGRELDDAAQNAQILAGKPKGRAAAFAWAKTRAARAQATWDAEVRK